MTADFPAHIHPFSEPLVQAQAPLAENDARDLRCAFDETPALTTALRAGDDDAFRWLHAKWNSRLSRYCFALASGDEVFASEIAQATYLRVARHIRELPDETALWNWLALAARCAANESRRTGGRYRRALSRFAEWLNSLRREPAPDADGAMLAALDAALAKLSDDERELIEARYFQRLSLDEIAARFRATNRAIEGRLARLRERLKQSIAAELLSQKIAS